MSDKENEAAWFSVEKKRENLFQITEPFFYEGNRCNIWLLRGGHTDLVIDCGLGVCNLRSFLEGVDLLDPVDKPNARPCVVICTHVHFDHSGGAIHFEKVYIHKDEVEALEKANKIHTLNWVKKAHFAKDPSPNFLASKYHVQKTGCSELNDGDRIEIGETEYVDVLHLPGHSIGSIAIHYPFGRAIFVGDVVYECGYGTGLLDWLPTSSVKQYIRSCVRLAEFLESSVIKDVYPGHYTVLTPTRAQELLHQYIEYKQNFLSRGFARCLKFFSTLYFKCR